MAPRVGVISARCELHPRLDGADEFAIFRAAGCTCSLRVAPVRRGKPSYQGHRGLTPRCRNGSTHDRRDPDPGGAVPGRRRGGGAAGQAAAHRQRAGLPAGRRADRAVRARLRLLRLRGELGAALRRVRRGAAAVPDRPGAAPQAPVGHARGHLRPRRRPGGASPALLLAAIAMALGPGLAGGAVRRPGAVAVVDRLCPAGAGGEGRAGAAPRPHGLRRAAVPGPGGDPADRAARRCSPSRRAARPQPMELLAALKAIGVILAGGRGRPLRARRPDPHRSPARASRRR